MAAVWFRFRAELRTRWRTWLGLALLVGLAGGIVLTAAAGARRTDSAYPRFLDESVAFDVLVVPDSLDVETSIEDFYPRVAELPQVGVFGVVVGMFLLPASSNAGDLLDTVQFAPTDDTAFQEAFRPNVVEGRFPDPRRVDEIAIDPRYARTAGLDPGDEIVAIAVDTEALLEKYGSETAAMEAVEAGEEGERLRFTVTGIAVTPDNLVVDEGFETGYAYYTPAFYERYPTSSAGYSGAAVKLKRGAADEQAFRRRVEALVPDETIEFQSRALIDETVDRAVRPYTVALWVFAAAIGLTAILILGQAIARQRFLDAVEDSPLAAIGCSRGQLLGLVMLRTATFAVPGALVAVIIAAVASPIMPLGPARDAEVDAGFAIDVLTLGLGGVAVTFLVFLLALFAARRLILRGDPEREDHGSAIARLVARIGLGPSAANGIRFAVESGRGRTAVPARTTLVTSTVAVATVLAALTFAAGLDRLIETPRLFGVTWQLEAEGGGEGVEQAQRDRERIDAALRAEQSVDGWSRLSASRLLVDGTNVPAVAFTPVEGDVEPTIAAGRRPRSDYELALGKRTLDRLGVGIGDSVRATFLGANRDLRVVGRVVLPGLGNYPGGDKTSPGDGALVTAAALRELSPAFTFSRNVVRLEDGVDVSAVRRRVAGYIGAGSDDFRVRGVQQPADVVDLERVRSTPVILAAMLGLLGAATIAHALVTTIRRRRRDLAMLKTLGFTRGQVSGAIAWQASTIAVIAVVVGVPLGVAAGRAAWSLLASSVGVLNDPAVAWLAVALALPTLLIGANVVAAVPAWLAARTRPATVLRSE